MITTEIQKRRKAEAQRTREDCPNRTLTATRCSARTTRADRIGNVSRLRTTGRFPLPGGVR